MWQQSKADTATGKFSFFINSEIDEENDLPITTDEDFDLIEQRLANKEYKEAIGGVR